MRDVGILVFPGFQLLDLSGPLAAFEVAGGLAPGDGYCLHVVSPEGGMVASSAGLPVLTQPHGGLRFDTFIVTGGAACRSTSGARQIAAAVQEHAKHARRIGSVCTGAFALALAGLLDGRRATTHWRHRAALQKRFPQVRVDAGQLFVADGKAWTCAGTNAAIDMALAMIGEDLGLAVARATANQMVAQPRGPQFGGRLDLQPETERTRKALDYARRNLHDNLPVDRLAEAACLSPRQLTRAFAAEMGITPGKAVERLRADVARMRVETGRESMESIARVTGFGNTERMRRAFLRVFGQPPQALRDGQR